ncbi:TPA_asm: hypothetical protein vir519_00054 [Caudoviricetes sp. vir519]|nr:TPA_asm: hypothetical protein vir519_00054 [Caudoviricetes sp. vir519]
MNIITPVIFNLPLFEEVVQIGSRNLKEISMASFKKAGYQVHTCEGQHAVREDLFPLISQHEIRYLSCVGHGNPWILTGENFATILESDDQTSYDVASGMVIVALSCSVGAHLAQELVDHGAVTVFAYKEDFVLSNDPDDEKYFLLPHCTIDTSIADGMTTGDAYKMSQAMWEQAYNSCQDPFAKCWIWNDWKNQDIFGRTDVRILPKDPELDPDPPTPGISPWIYLGIGIVIVVAALAISKFFKLRGG